jgi:hypothetical protein
MIFSIFKKKKEDEVADIKINADAETLVAKTTEERLKEQQNVDNTEVVADKEVLEPMSEPEE